MSSGSCARTSAGAGRRIASIAIALVSAAALLAGGHHSGDAAALEPSVREASTSSAKRGLGSLPLPAQSQISAALGRDDPAYRVHGRHSDSAWARNPAHDLRVRFREQGIVVDAGPGDLHLSLRALGYGRQMRPVAEAAPAWKQNRIEYRRGPLTEWYVNGPLGLEQGFTLSSPPEGRRSGLLMLGLQLRGAFLPELSGSGRALTLRTAAGPALRYRGLWARDAGGRELPARLDLRKGTLYLRVDDAGARYPLTIDPFLQRATLTAADGAAVDYFGSSVSIAGDTIVVGAPSDDLVPNSGRGSAYVFVKPPAGWPASPTQTAKLTASDGAEDDTFGASVSISGDTIVVGARGDDVGANFDQGSAYVFLKPSGGWVGSLAQNAKLTASDGAVDDDFGASVAVSGDTIVVGAVGDEVGANGSQGSAYVFVKPPSGWAGSLTQSAKLTATDGAAADSLGSSVSVAGDTVVAGALFDDVGPNANQGSAYVFVRPPGGWAGSHTENAKLTASFGAAQDLCGVTVSIASDTIVVGAPGDDVGAQSDQGVAVVFSKPGGGWSGGLTENAVLTTTDGSAGDGFGAAVAIAGDTVAVGARLDDVGAPGNEGSAYVFLKPSGGWSGIVAETAKLTGSNGAAFDIFGGSVALAGETIVVGAPGDDVGANGDQGSAYVFEDGMNPAANPSVDFDGDRITDFGLYRGLSPADSLWHAPATGGGGPFQVSFGATTDVPVPGDYDGDGRTDAVIYRPSTGLWYGPRTGAAQIVVQIFLGQPGDIPIPGDYDGDGRTDPAIFRPSSGLFFAVDRTGSTVLLNRTFGAESVPVPRDYDGDGKTDPAIYLENATPEGYSLWFASLSGGGDHAIYFGAPGDIPVPGDYDGDKKADSVIWRPSTGLWYGPRTGAAQIAIQMNLGQNGDVPIPGYYDANLATDPAIFRPSSGLWFSALSGGGTRSIAGMGQPNDVPVQKRPALAGGT